MREWNFENGIIVEECAYDYSLHCFKVYNGDVYLGAIYPDTIEDMESCAEELDAGYDPISAQWEDGLGNSCTMGGWGMREWNFANGIIVKECAYGYELRCFKVYKGDAYLGGIYPDTIEDMEYCIESLDNGEDPISGAWEDGMGNLCTEDGWGENND